MPNQPTSQCGWRPAWTHTRAIRVLTALTIIMFSMLLVSLLVTRIALLSDEVSTLRVVSPGTPIRSVLNALGPPIGEYAREDWPPAGLSGASRFEPPASRAIWILSKRKFHTLLVYVGENERVTRVVWLDTGTDDR